MQTIEYTTIDKSDWKNGPWKNEPDKVQWPDRETGLPCLIIRNSLGVLCGYVGIPATHRLHGVSYLDISADLRVHGGLTYSDSCQKKAPAEVGICHVPEPGEPDDLWWFGFDCAHYLDAWPSPNSINLGADGTYRDIDYVRRETQLLAAQLAALMESEE